MKIFDLKRPGFSHLTVFLSTIAFFFYLRECYIREQKIENITHEKEIYENQDDLDVHADPMEQSSESVIKAVKEVIESGANEKYPVNVRESIKLGQIGQIGEVVKYFKNKKGGYFLESGAFDGVYLSNTIYLEAKLGWSGLLVEPNKEAYAGIKNNHRKAASLNACLSPSRYAEVVTFDAADVVGGIQINSKEADTKGWVPSNKRSKYKLKCYPLYSIIMALGNPQIDFWSLDIEGLEEAVIDTLPWDKVDIKSILIEVEHSDRNSIISKLTSHGYRIQKEFGQQDIFFTKD